MQELIKSTIDELNQYQLGNVTRQGALDALNQLTRELELDLALDLLSKNISKTMPYEAEYCEDKYMEGVWNLLYLELKDRLVK